MTGHRSELNAFLTSSVTRTHRSLVPDPNAAFAAMDRTLSTAETVETPLRNSYLAPFSCLHGHLGVIPDILGAVSPEACPGCPAYRWVCSLFEPIRADICINEYVDNDDRATDI